MSFYIKMLSYCIMVCFFISCQKKQGDNAETIKINANWKFIEADVPNAKEVNFDDSGWKTVNLPHDWSISKPFSKDNPAFSRGAWLPAGISYYRKVLDISHIGEKQKIFIHFEGAYRNAEVWINGRYLGKRPSGYSAFEYEITKYVTKDYKNVLTVKLDNSEQPGSRWYTGNGIYRDVFLIIKNEVYIPTWATYVTTPKVDKKESAIKVETEIINTSDKTKKLEIKTSILNLENIVVSTHNTILDITANSKSPLSIELVVKNPHIWKLNTPYLYQVKVEVLDGKVIVDTDTVTTGIRNMEYTVEKGFILNGEPTKIKGVCLHHAAGPLGAAARSTSYERQIRVLKEMGTNAIRTAHNPFDSEFLEACDRMGMLVMNEAFDEWEIPKEPQTFREKGNKIRIPITYYANIFKEWSDRDLTDFILRDRNHPSIFMWSIGNEIDQMRDESGVAIAKRLEDIVHTYDYRPATCGVNGFGWEWPHEPAVAQIDVPGYNYATGENYDKEHKDFPNRKMIATEQTSAQMIANRGEYYPFKSEDQAMQLDLPMEHPDTQKFVMWRDFYNEGINAWMAIKNRPFVMGEFIWTGWDYLGETIPYSWPARSSSFGVVDLAGFPKDGYYYYQSQWTDKPMIHIFPHWNWKGHEGEKINLNVFSNAQEIEVFINGVSQGKKENDMNSTKMLTWNVTYQPGFVKAIGYQNGKKIVEEIVRTADETHTLKLKVTDNSEIVYVEVTAIDIKGDFVPTAENKIDFSIENAEILGVANGNNRSLEPFVATYRKLYHGKATVILKKKAKGQVAKLGASIDGITKDEVTF